MGSLNKAPHLVSAGSDQDQAKGKRVSKRYLVNRLNYLNFQDRSIQVNFKHKKYGTIISLQAKPLPCAEDRLDCLWAESPPPERLTQDYTLHNLSISDDTRLLLVKPGVISISDKLISLRLPETCDEVEYRKGRRYPCDGIQVKFMQNSALFAGCLVDFSAASLRVEITAVPPQTFQWVNPDLPVSLVIDSGQEHLYSGECRIIRQTGEEKTRTFVLEPLHQQIRRFAPKEYRSSRVKLVPAPDVVFTHPLTKKTVSLKTIDLSGSGFSVAEDRYNSVLLPGLMIPALELNYANSFRFTCCAQVIYRNVPDEGADDTRVKCGLAILDMDAADHVRHLAILHQAADERSYLCNDVDMDALWQFFFESGFIYPQKYAFLQANKEKLKDTFSRLYTQHPQIARHFIYQDKGVILGHIAMVRFYTNSWLIHHHAASKARSSRAGLVVLKQISHYVNDLHNLLSARLRYVFCYFRPENKFPNRIFGGFARELNDPAGCSLDSFAYFHFQRPYQKRDGMPEPWELTQTGPDDLAELQSYYGGESGGLMLNALDLEPGADREQLSQEYRQLDFKRESLIFSLKKDGSLKAVLMVNVSDPGLNLSDFTNCTKVIVLDGEDLSQDILTAALARVSATYEENGMPVLLYPVSYAEGKSILYEKIYTMWTLNLRYLDHYFRYCAELFRHSDRDS